MTTNQIMGIVGILLIFAAVMIWFWGQMQMDLLEDEREFLMEEKKTDKERLIELLKKANIEFEEWNTYMMTWDDGYVEAIFDTKGVLKDIRTRHVAN